MATKKGQVTLRGRFPEGTSVELVKVRDESVLRTSAGDEVVDSGTVKDGEISFTKGVEVGSRYMIRGRTPGGLLEVRARGNESGDDAPILSQPPIGYERQKLADGRFVDELADVELDAPAVEVQPAAKQEHARNVRQRSATPIGYATPVDPDEVPPYGRQEDHDGNVARSDTETGQAALIPVDTPPERQEDADDGKLMQRSDTPLGVTTPIPVGDAVQATHDRDAADSKDMGGTEPNKAAARPAVGRDGPKARAARKTSGGRKTTASKKTARKRSR